MLNTILQALDLTSLEGLAFPLVEINPYPNIYSKTVESGDSLNGMPTKWMATINTKSKDSGLGLKRVYRARVSKLV